MTKTYYFPLLIILLSICFSPVLGYCSFTFGWNTSSYSAAAGSSGMMVRDVSGSIHLFGGGSEILNATTDAYYVGWSLLDGLVQLVQLVLSLLFNLGRPGGRLGGVSWIENGNFMLFGGATYLNDNSLVLFGDFWSRGGSWAKLWPIIPFSPLVNILPNFSNSSSARPGSTAFPLSAQDSNTGDLYMFGGLFWTGASNSPVALTNNLWVRRNSTWKFLSGAQLAVEPNNVLSPPQNPGGRMKGCMWTTSTGFWIFGGKKAENGLRVVTNEMWQFTESTAVWSFYDMSNRQPTTMNGTYSTTYAPEPRFGHTCWQDHLGQFWMFGGTNAGGNLLADVWSFDAATLQWASWWPPETFKSGIYDLPGSATDVGSRHGSLSTFDVLSLSVTLFGGMIRTGSSTGPLAVSGNAFTATLSCNNFTIKLPTLPPFPTLLPILTWFYSKAPPDTNPISATTAPPQTALPAVTSSEAATTSPPTTTPILSFLSTFPPGPITKPILIVSDSVVTLNTSLVVQLANQSNGQVQVQGCVNLAGSLEIELVEQPQYGVAVPLVSSNANCLNGSFDHIKISANYTDSLSNRTTTCVPEYQVQQTSNSLAVIFRPPKNSNCNGRNKNVPRWVIAVAVVSCVVFVVVGVSAILVLRRYGYLKWVMRSREKTLSRTKPLASSSSSYTMMNDRGEL